MYKVCHILVYVFCLLAVYIMTTSCFIWNVFIRSPFLKDYAFGIYQLQGIKTEGWGENLI
jgi:hypothetical protein